jgi:hypothetical protein
MVCFAKPVLTEDLCVVQKEGDIEDRSDRMEWRKAIKEELEALVENKTWEIANLPEEKKPLDCRWVFTIKRNKERERERYKARLVVKGSAVPLGWARWLLRAM